MTDSVTPNVALFVKENDKSLVYSGAAFPGGGGSYSLESGKSFRFTLQEARSLPLGYPKWKI